MEIQRPYLGTVKGYYTDWTPLQSVESLFQGEIDKRDPWQFQNILVP
jgi:homospermidine synthase